MLGLDEGFVAVKRKTPDIRWFDRKHKPGNCVSGAVGSDKRVEWRSKGMA